MDKNAAQTMLEFAGDFLTAMSFLFKCLEVCMFSKRCFFCKAGWGRKRPEIDWVVLVY